jgi:hypothetical protein
LFPSRIDCSVEEVLSAVVDLHSKNPFLVLESSLFQITDELVARCYFDIHRPPPIADVQSAQDLILQIDS